MANFLWDLEIENISCGWEFLYREALANYPDGKFVETITSDSHGTQVKKCFFHPVMCRQLLVNKFNALKLEANELYKNINTLDFKMCCNRLLKIDILLYYILLEWTYTSVVYCNDEFQPDVFIKNIDNYSYDTYFEDESSEFYSLKFINPLL